ncbi:hypothetical protein [Merismopedia glauca]|uniref:hypothetical protein n=1 Tax=Merismopedia glauca TaxID=292586 RepID=UPI0030D876D3
MYLTTSLGESVAVRNQELQPSELAQSQAIWKIAECAAVGASVVGVFASAISAQVAYVAAPISLSLCLNLLNRYRWEKQSQHLSVAMARVYRRLDEIEQSAPALPSRQNQAPAWENLQEVQELTNDRIKKLIHEQSQLHIRLAQIATQTADLDREHQYNQRLISDFGNKFAQLNSSNGKDPNSSLLKELQNRLAKIEALDLMAQQSTLEQLKQLVSQPNLTLEPRLQEQETAIAHLQERLLSLEGLEVENQLLEVLQVHLRLYKWQQELTAEINQRLTPVVVEMQLGRQRQLALETKVAEFAVIRCNGSAKTAELSKN